MLTVSEIKISDLEPLLEKMPGVEVNLFCSIMSIASKKGLKTVKSARLIHLAAVIVGLAIEDEQKL